MIVYSKHICESESSWNQKLFMHFNKCLSKQNKCSWFFKDVLISKRCLSIQKTLPIQMYFISRIWLILEILYMSWGWRVVHGRWDLFSKFKTFPCARQWQVCRTVTSPFFTTLNALRSRGYCIHHQREWEER